MKYSKIDKSLFITNRERLKKQLKPNSIVVLNSNDVLPTNADGTMPFKQNNGLLESIPIEAEEIKELMRTN
jgi:Xaa-Pro aminopeptidase